MINTLQKRTISLILTMIGALLISMSTPNPDILSIMTVIAGMIIVFIAGDLNGSCGVAK